MPELRSADDIHARVFADPEFQALQRRRSRMSWTLAALMFGAFVIYINVIAFRPQWFAYTLGPNTVITWGVPVGVGLILLGFVLTGYYVWSTNRVFDPGTEAIIKRLADRT